MYKVSKFNREKIKIRKIKKTLKISMNILVYIILIPILIMSFNLIIKSIVNPTEIPSVFGYKILTIVSKSMEPEIKVGDAVIISNINEYEIQVGDIISFYSDENLITHRVTSIENISGKLYFTTKGDNNFQNDQEIISIENIEGKVIIKLSNFENILKILRSPVIFITIIVFLILNVIYSIKINKQRKLRKQKREEYEKNNISKGDFK